MRALALLLLLAGCALTTARDARVLVIGDSVLRWGRLSGDDVGSALSRALGAPVESRAVLGARVSSPDGGGLLGPDISRQDVSGSFDWIVTNGGANDLAAECGCGACGGTLDALIAPNGLSGEIPSFVARLRSTGARVIYVSYYGPSGRGGAFDACEGELMELADRAEAMAAAMDGVIHVPTARLISRADPSDYASDDVHPSASGARDIAGAVAAVIRTGG